MKLWCNGEILLVQINYCLVYSQIFAKFTILFTFSKKIASYPDKIFKALKTICNFTAIRGTLYRVLLFLIYVWQNKSGNLIEFDNEMLIFC